MKELIGLIGGAPGAALGAALGATSGLTSDAVMEALDSDFVQSDEGPASSRSLKSQRLFRLADQQSAIPDMSEATTPSVQSDPARHAFNPQGRDQYRPPEVLPAGQSSGGLNQRLKKRVAWANSSQPMARRQSHIRDGHMTRDHTTISTEPSDQSRVGPHQPGQAVFKAIATEDIDWQPFPAFPPSVRLAVVVGHPSHEGPYVIRVKVPRAVKLMPHQHPEDRIYTVISGVFYIGLGDQFDAEQLEAYPPGTVIVLPGHTPHFHWAKSGEYITQVNAIGPLGIEYVNPKDDPRL